MASAAQQLGAMIDAPASARLPVQHSRDMPAMSATINAPPPGGPPQPTMGAPQAPTPQGIYGTNLAPANAYKGIAAQYEQDIAEYSYRAAHAATNVGGGGGGAVSSSGPEPKRRP